MELEKRLRLTADFLRNRWYNVSVTDAKERGGISLKDIIRGADLLGETSVIPIAAKNIPEQSEVIFFYFEGEHDRMTQQMRMDYKDRIIEFAKQRIDSTIHVVTVDEPAIGFEDLLNLKLHEKPLSSHTDKQISDIAYNSGDVYCIGLGAPADFGLNVFMQSVMKDVNAILVTNPYMQFSLKQRDSPLCMKSVRNKVIDMHDYKAAMQMLADDRELDAAVQKEAKLMYGTKRKGVKADYQKGFALKQIRILDMLLAAKDRGDYDSRYILTRANKRHFSRPEHVIYAFKPGFDILRR